MELINQLQLFNIHIYIIIYITGLDITRGAHLEALQKKGLDIHEGHEGDRQRAGWDAHESQRCPEAASFGRKSSMFEDVGEDFSMILVDKHW
jgi:hypothetical protein